MTLKAVLLIFTVLFSGSHEQCFSSNDTAPVSQAYQYDVWVGFRDRFSLSLLKALNNESKQQNVIFSPSSVHDLLLLTYFGAANATEESVAKVLQFGSAVKKSKVWRYYRTEKLLTSDQDISSYPLKIASKIFVSNKLRLRPCIKENLWRETELIDYLTDVEWAQNHINNWVSSATQGEIKDVIKNLSPDSTATLVNAVYFKAKWLSEFNPNHTKYLPFRLNSKDTKKTSMMVKTDDFSFGYVKDLKARMLKIPYVGERIAMYILLPDDDLDSMIEDLDEYSIKLIIDPYEKLNTSYFEVRIPKFVQRNRLDLVSTLEKLGIGNTFTRNADFSTFTGKKEIYFNEVVHEAVIKVNEEGTTAAAATLGVYVKKAKTPQEPFHCDRPFVYFIYDYLASKFLFMGIFRDPETI